MKLTKQQVLSLNAGLQNVSNLPGAKWAYAVARNLSKLKSEIDALQKAYSASQEFLEYEEERVKLAELHAIKVKGEPKKIKENGVDQYVIKDQKKFDTEIADLQKKYKKAIDGRKKQLDEFQEILKEEIEIDLYRIYPAYLPKGITPQQLSK